MFSSTSAAGGSRIVIWIIGLSGSGKSTIGREVHARLKEHRTSVVFLDGDAVREIMGNDLGHGIKDRLENAWRVCRLCAYLDGQGVDVVCAILSIFPETRAWNRRTYPRYFEVFVDVPLDVLVARDDKGIYCKALAGQLQDVVGVDLPFERPTDSDLVIENTFAPGSAATLADRIIRAIGMSGRS